LVILLARLSAPELAAGVAGQIRRDSVRNGVSLENVRLPAKAGLHDEIIRASIELGSELGEDGMTMRAIASRLRISATGLYQHFESKASILREIRFHGVRMLQGELLAASTASDDRQRLRDLACAYVAFARANPWLYKVLFLDEELDWSTMPDDERHEALMPMATTGATFRAGIEHGVFRADLDPEQAVLLTWASLHGLAALMLHGRISDGHPAYPVPDLEQFIELFVENLVRAFLLAPTTARPA
jgi:AcrR family transcriptional regulator